MNRTTIINPILNDSELEKFRNDLNFLNPIIKHILEQENIYFNKISIFETGSSIVIDIGDHKVLKVFPSFLKQDYESELNALKLLNNNKIANIPKLYSFGKIEYYFYVIISKIPGVTLESVWNTLNLENKISIMYSVGRFLKSIHLIPLNDIKGSEIKWKIFKEKQMTDCANYHEKNGLNSLLVSQIDNFISLYLHNQVEQKRICFLSGDVHYWNIFVKEQNGKFEISGFIDYGDSFYGEPEYDFLAPQYFMAYGKDAPQLLRALFFGYGYSKEELTKNLSYKMLSFQLIHRFSKFKETDPHHNFNTLAEELWHFSG